MNLRARVKKLLKKVIEQEIEEGPSLLVCTPVKTDPDGRAVGEYHRGSVIDLLYGGMEPDEAVVNRLQSRMPACGLTIVCHSD